MLAQRRKVILLILTVSLIMTLILPTQSVLAADPTVTTGRILSATMAGDNSDWIEIAQFGGYSLIVRKTVIGYQGFGSTSYYPNSSAYTTVNNWFKNTLSSGARLRDYTVNNDAKSRLGYWAVPSDGFSKPYPEAAPTAARTGDDVAFLLSFGEAAVFCSSQYVINNGLSYAPSSNNAYSNFSALEWKTEWQPLHHWWLRSPGGLTDRACTVGLGGSSEWGSVRMEGAVNQYQISSNLIGIRPALWVGSGIFTVTRELRYDANGGYNAPPSVMVPVNTTISLSNIIPSHTDTAKTFQGWSQSSSGTAPIYQPGNSFTMVAGTTPVTLYAVWGTVQNVTLHYYPNGTNVIGLPLDQTGPQNTPMTVSTATVTRSGYTFNNWSVNPGALVGEFPPGSIISMGTADRELYAIWTPIGGGGDDLWLHYNANGGSGAPQSQEVNANSNAAISHTIPTRQNYTFLGWDTNPNAVTARYQPGGNIYINTTSVTLHAIWGSTANGPFGVDGRILTPDRSGDTVNWIEIARYSNYSLIVRSRYLRILQLPDVPEQQYIPFGANTNYNSDSCTLRIRLNRWFNGTQTGVGVDNLASNARMRDYTMNNNATSNLGTATSAGSENTGFSRPTIGSPARTGENVTFPLSFGEAANFISYSYFIRGPLGRTPSNDIAQLNMAKIYIPPLNPTGTQIATATGAWLRSPGDLANTVGALGSIPSDSGRVFQINLQYIDDVVEEAGFAYPALWVEQGVFNLDSYTLTYRANGGVGAPPPVSIPTNTSILLSNVIPTREDYDFLGWSLDRNATTASYQPGQSFNIGVGHKWLYAVWKPKEGVTVYGFVWPIATDYRGLGDVFLSKHDIVVELRPTFNTPAAAGLSVTAELMSDSDITNVGKFTFNNVPVGNYVLYIKRPGFLVRCMNVSITTTTQSPYKLEPPGAADGGIFNLWWGDCNDDMRIDNADVQMILELMSVHANALNSYYLPECDLNADGLIDNADIQSVLEMWNRYVLLYPGAENVDIYS